VPEALIDTDVLYKSTIYGLLSRWIAARPFGANRFSMLVAAKYMIHKKISKRPPARGAAVAIAEFEAAVATLNELEPSSEEIKIAAELEHEASNLNLELDGGESILCAILMHRNSDYIFTGDKRAIRAMAELIAQGLAPALLLAEKVVCFEQLLMFLIRNDNASEIRTLICAAPTADKALTSCFSCQSPQANVDSWHDGLNSYINSLRREAPGMLADVA